jgi:hypothetical protein
LEKEMTAIGVRPAQDLFNDIGSVENPVDSQSPIGVPVYIGPLSGAPSINTTQLGAHIIITGYPVGGRARFWNNGTAWVPAGSQLIHYNKTQSVGIASATNQLMGVSQAIPKLWLAGLYELSVDVSVSKSGTTDIVTLNVYIGPLGTSADTLVYSTAAALAAASRQGVSGLTLLYRPSSDRLVTAWQPGGAQGSVAGSTVPYPTSQSAVLGAADQFVSIHLFPAGATDTPALERFAIRGV